MVRTGPGLNCDHSCLPEKIDEGGRLLGRDTRPQLSVAERPLELRQECFGNDKLEVTCAPALEGARGRAGARKQARNENVRVENRTHASAPASRPSLCFECQSRCLVFGEVIALPETIEQVESQLAPKRLLNHLTIALTGVGAVHPDCTEDLLVDRQCCP